MANFESLFIFELQQTMFNTNWKCSNFLEIENVEFWHAVYCSLFSQQYSQAESMLSVVLWQQQESNSKWYERPIWLLGWVFVAGVGQFRLPGTHTSFQRLSPFHDLRGDVSDENISKIPLAGYCSFIDRHKKYFCTHAKPFNIYIFVKAYAWANVS